MIYNHLTLRQDVRTALDENPVAAQFVAIGESDTVTLDDIIESKLVDAAKAVEMEAPVWMLDSGHSFADEVWWNTDGTGWTLLPEDFMRLVTFKMSDWERPVCDTITETDAGYALQRSRYAGIRGNPQRPVCALVVRAEGRVMEFYSCNTTETTVEQAVYVPLPILVDGGLDICERCYRPVVYYAAGLTAQAVGDANAATPYFELAKSLME